MFSARVRSIVIVHKSAGGAVSAVEGEFRGGEGIILSSPHSVITVQL